MLFLKSFLFRESVLVFVFSLAVIAGPALSILFANDLSQFTDSITYTGLAGFDFDQSAVRRYRVIIPMAAAALNFAAGPVFERLAPTYFTGNFSLPFSFFLVNSLLMAYFGVLVYRYCRAYGLPLLSAIVGLLVVLTARYTVYFAALPLVDSLFCVVVAMTLLGIREKNTAMLVTCIFIGPLAKEAFIFIAPLIFFFSHLSRKRMIFYFLLSGALVFSFHYVYDLLWPPEIIGWFKADLHHISNIQRHIPMLLSFYGLYKILINIGLWILIPVTALMVSAETRRRLREILKLQHVVFFLMILLMMLLSGSMERMFYLAMPVVALVVAVCSGEVKGYAGRATGSRGGQETE